MKTLKGYTKRDPLFDSQTLLPVSRFRARLDFIFNSLREGIEVRRSHRERQLERREERVKLQAACPPGAVVNEAYIKAGPEADASFLTHPDAFATLAEIKAKADAEYDRGEALDSLDA